MSCTVYGLDMYQGATLSLTIRVTDSAGDLLAISSVDGKIRASLKAGAATILDLSSYLTIPSLGIVQLTIPAAITDTTVQTNGQLRCPYDILATLTDSGETVTVLKGTVNLIYSATELT